MEIPRIELGTYPLRTERATTTPYPQLSHVQASIKFRKHNHYVEHQLDPDTPVAIQENRT